MNYLNSVQAGINTTETTTATVHSRSATATVATAAAAHQPHSLRALRPHANCVQNVNICQHCVPTYDSKRNPDTQKQTQIEQSICSSPQHVSAGRTRCVMLCASCWMPCWCFSSKRRQSNHRNRIHVASGFVASHRAVETLNGQEHRNHYVFCQTEQFPSAAVLNGKSCKLSIFISVDLLRGASSLITRAPSHHRLHNVVWAMRNLVQWFGAWARSTILCYTIYDIFNAAFVYIPVHVVCRAVARMTTATSRRQR